MSWYSHFVLAALLAAGAAGQPLQVGPLHGRPALFHNGTPVPPFAYMSYLGEAPWYRQAAEAGIHLYCVPAYLGDRGINPRSGIGPFRPALWQAPGRFDFTPLAGELGVVGEADPEAAVVIRLHLDPPAWWEAAHPEACCRLPDGTTFRQCFASPAWREATADVLRRVVRWVLHDDAARQVVGIHVAAGGTEEWFYHFQEQFHDENPARTEAFRAWLREAYGDDPARLRAAWGDGEADFTTAAPADISGADRAERWRHPAVEQAVLDTFRFHCETLAEDIAFFCGVVKEASAGRLLAGAFFGYSYFVTDPRRGHGALAKLLACPYVDFLSSPNVYHRVLGEDWPPMVPLASVMRAGKLWLAENDTRTFRTSLLKDRAPDVCPPGEYQSGVWLGPESAGDSVALLEKNTARMLAGGYGGWWFDMWGGWFSDPALLAVLTRTQELGALDLSEPGPPMPAEVAVVIDEQLCFRDASFGGLTGQILGNRSPLAKSGAPYDLYLREDLDAVMEGTYRAVWLLGVPDLSEEEAARADGWARDGRTVVWTRPEGTSVRLPGRDAEERPGDLRFTSEEMRRWWKAAGVHVYLDTDDVLYAGRGWVCLHTVEGGERTLKLPFRAAVTDAFRGTDLSDGTDELALNLPARSTTLLRLRPVAE